MPTLAELEAKYAAKVGEPTTPAPQAPPAAPLGLSLAGLEAKFAPTPAVADVTAPQTRAVQAGAESTPKHNILRRTPFDETTPLTFIPELGGNFLKGVAQQGIGLSEFGGIVLRETATPLIAATGDVAQAVTDPAAARGSMAEHALQGLGHAVSLSGKIAATPQKVRGLIDKASEAIATTAQNDPAQLLTAPLAWAYENPYETLPLFTGAARGAAQAALPGASKTARGAILRGGGPAASKAIAAEEQIRRVAEEGPFEALRVNMRDRMFGPESGRLERNVENIRGLKASKMSQYAVNTNRVATEMGKKFKLPQQDIDQFADYVTGIREVPTNASPELREALTWYRNLSAQQQSDAINLGLFSAEDATSRAYQPLRVAGMRSGAEAYLHRDPLPTDPLAREGYIQAFEYVEDFKRQGGNIKEAESSLAQEIATRKALGTLPERATEGRLKEFNDAIAAKLAAAGRDQPVYFPEYRSLERGAEYVGPSAKPSQRYKPGFAKRSTGQTLSEGAPKIDPRIAIDRRNRAHERYKMHEEMLRAIEDDATRPRKYARPPKGATQDELSNIAKNKVLLGEAALEPELQAMRSAERADVPIDVAVTRQRRAASRGELVPDEPNRGRSFGARKLARGEEPLPHEMVLVLDGFRQMYRKSLDMTDEVTQGLVDGLQMDEAFAKALASQMNVVAQGLDVRNATRIAVPRQVGMQLAKEFGSTDPLIRVFYDKPIEWWRTAVLALRPAWVANNILSNVLLTQLQGVAPESYIKALQEAYKAKMPNELGAGGFGAIEGAAHSLDDIIEHGTGATKIVAQTAKAAESLPGLVQVGKLADRSRAFNGAVEDFFRRASYIQEAQKFARKNYVQRTGDRFFKLYDELQEFDTLRPEQMKKAVQETNFWLNDYLNGLQPWERKFMRRAIPFWSFYRFQARLALQLPTTHPGRATMIQLLAKAGREAAEDNEAPPAYMEGQGIVDTGHDVEVSGRKMRMFAATGGWNPTLIGQGPQSVGIDPQGGGASASDLVNAIASQGGPFLQYVKRSITDKDAFGREFKDPLVYGSQEVGFGKIDPKTNKPIPPRRGGYTEYPEPTFVESMAQNFPQLRLGKAAATMFARGPNAPTPNWSARPFAMQPSKDTEKAMAFSRSIDDALAYFTGVRLILVDVDQARKGELRGMVVTPRDMRRLMRSGAKRGVLLRSAERDTTQ